MKQILYYYRDEYVYLLILKDFKYTLYEAAVYEIIYKDYTVEIYKQEELIATLNYFEVDKSYCLNNLKQFNYNYFNINNFLDKLIQLNDTISNLKKYIDVLEERGINIKTVSCFDYSYEYKLNHFKENRFFYALSSRLRLVDINHVCVCEPTYDSYIAKNYFIKYRAYATDIKDSDNLNEYINNIPSYFIQFKIIFNI